MIPSALFRLERSASTCSSLQQTSESFHLGPQRSTSDLRSSSVGVAALPLSGHGRSAPNHPCLPQWPRIAHRPASWMAVGGAAAESWADSATATVANERSIIKAASYSCVERAQRMMVVSVQEYVEKRKVTADKQYELRRRCDRQPRICLPCAVSWIQAAVESCHWPATIIRQQRH